MNLGGSNFVDTSRQIAALRGIPRSAMIATPPVANCNAGAYK